MLISDWSSDVCSSELRQQAHGRDAVRERVMDLRVDRKAMVFEPFDPVAFPQGPTAIEAMAMKPGDQLPEFPLAARSRQRVMSNVVVHVDIAIGRQARSEEHTSELQSLMRISYAVFCLKKKKTNR